MSKTTKPSIANRELPAAEVVTLFKQHLPALIKGLGADREWLWWSGPKQDEATRTTLTEMGWRFSGKPHVLPDGRTAHWYHSCGGAVLFRRKGRAPSAENTETDPESARQLAGAPSTLSNTSQHSKGRPPPERYDPTKAPPKAGGLDGFMNFANQL